MATKILIIDSDISLSTVLCDYLVSRGYEAQYMLSGKAALDSLANEQYDALLMEIQGIGINGYELMKSIRRRYPKIPLVVLTTRTAREDQIRAFGLGADDYQTKPFSMDILICRIEAILRRIREYEANRQKIFELNSHTFDALHQNLNGQHLSSRESEILLMLCRNEGEIVDKHLILSSVWKADNAFTARSLGVFINHLRSYLRPIGYDIIAVRYKGYKLVKSLNC